MNIPTDIVKINYIRDRAVDFFTWCRENKIEIIIDEKRDSEKGFSQFYATTKQTVKISHVKDGSLRDLPICRGGTPETAIEELARVLSDSTISIGSRGSSDIRFNVPAFKFDIYDHDCDCDCDCDCDHDCDCEKDILDNLSPPQCLACGTNAKMLWNGESWVCHGTHMIPYLIQY